MTDFVKLELVIETSDTADFAKSAPLIQWEKWASSTQTKVIEGKIRVNQNTNEVQPLADFSSVLALVLQNVSGHRNALTLQGSFGGSTESFHTPPGAIMIWPRDAGQVSFTTDNTGNFTNGNVKFAVIGT